MGALDATVHTVIANRFEVRGFPTIKFFPAGGKSFSDALDYDGGRTTYILFFFLNFSIKILEAILFNGQTIVLLNTCLHLN